MEALAPKLVFCAEYKTIRPMYLAGKGGIIVGEVWKSTVISGASFKTEPEAIAATIEKLKEVEKDEQ
jgi:N-dimethylarginine dimethylaminohydrolase